MIIFLEVSKNGGSVTVDGLRSDCFGGFLPVLQGITAILLYNRSCFGYNIMAKFDTNEEVSE